MLAPNNIFIILFLFVASSSAFADDTEIYVVTTEGDAQTNVLFVFDTSGSMWFDLNNCHTEEHSTCMPSKMDIVQDAATDLIDNFDGLNIGLMRFNKNSGGYVVSHFADITDNKDTIKAAIAALAPSGSTPLTETLWEASLYFRGKSVEYGSSSVAAAVTDGNYNSPMTASCQKNHIVYLTDGAPRGDNESDLDISALGTPCRHITEGATSSSETCFDELAYWLKNTDHSDSLSGTQDITLHTIGFDIDLELLTTAAEKGGGGAYTADDSSELADAFNEIFESILSAEENTFIAPVTTVSAYNSLQHEDDLYYALFQPKASPRWPGNLKGYRITNEAVILDADDNDAIDPDTGYFLDESRSYWSTSDDGNSITDGGFAEQMSLTRNIYTYTGASSSLTNSTNRLETSNALLTNTLMGLDSTASTEELHELIEWMRGEDTEDVNADSEVHNFIADALHTSPVVVTYGGTESSPDNTIYFANNMGMLHAVDADDGSELFAFIPQALLPNGTAYYENTSSRVYGLDGHITVWREESSDDTDQIIESADGDHVYLYIGMRRGGDNYYALDVTDRSRPMLKWQIMGGSGDYADLAQTWSKPILATVNWNCSDTCTEKTVLIFSGGYDTVHDTATSETTDDEGAAIFMIDAETGELLWSAGRSGHDLTLGDMENSIAANLTLADINDDGFIDIMFTVDLTGHVWRFDINSETTSAADFATGGIIAKLGDYDIEPNNDAANFRRFYYAPDVALWRPRGEEAFLTISLTSGYRAHPKDTTVTDRVYTLFDPNVFSAPSSYAGLDSSDDKPLDEGDLFDATDTDYDSSLFGWYKTFTGTDEKGLSTPTTFGGMLIFTTYIPNNDSDTYCYDIGGSRVYALNPLTGGGLLPDEYSVVNNYEYFELVNSGIAPGPSIIYTDVPDSWSVDQDVDLTINPVVCIGTECFDDLLPDADLVVRTFWKEN